MKVKEKAESFCALLWLHVNATARGNASVRFVVKLRLRLGFPLTLKIENRILVLNGIPIDSDWL
jgi:hypothetical protein